ncbi:uncharacterized protein CIMG_06962 [Coccidioides immitis RS]|uniref:Pru domain-containing protein n=3 Tax=Coccidioides immitis TaxID=5501 RepID=J3K9C1_COCIM|nr:uncharacterized protein CIMG_06962 [Coccidioides immitis RS]EAS31483.3 hypothetical protein CIMG_06962 [Coccidioides immitis RS]KMP04121.1 hypothetical protein CIRG_03812 [Coccidioides immitis RMSCC 2394]KMU91690.1 hypothetical protein CIHG_09497 [Coccidioides immitis H538.4]TPX24258.1 hypothetical protein DIZ76_013604 [Coccidioides immitis]
MSISPIITFKAGICDLDTSPTPPRVKPKQTPGYIYLYSEDDLVHFCWRPRSAPLDEPELDLVMVPMDATFTPYKPTSAENPLNRDRPTNGRIYVLKFSSSSQRFLFWLQSKSQHEHGNPAWFSARDLKLGQIVNGLLQGEEIDVQEAIASLPRNDDQDDDETMEDVEGTDHSPDHHRSGGGGAGPGATGGDIREEGEEAREGGADGGRAAASGSDPSAVVQDFLRSLQGSAVTQSESTEKPFATLSELLAPSSTMALVESADSNAVDHLLNFLPLSLLLLAQNRNIPTAEVRPEEAQKAMESLSLAQKKAILKRVLRSPQFAQSLGSLTVALRDGGLPSISDALNIKVENGGFMRRGGVPLGGGDAIRTFLEGVKGHVKEKQKPADSMETD